MTKSMHKVLHPLLAMAEKIHLETGYHVGGYTIHEDHEPLTRAATTDLQNICKNKGTQMHAQAAHLHALLQTQRMKSREIEADLAQLYCILPKPKGKGMRDHHRMVLLKILAFDANCIIGYGSNNNLDLRDPGKLQLTTFVKNAWRLHVHIINWAVGVPFIKCGVQTAKGFLSGHGQIHDFSAQELKAICSNRIKVLVAEAEGKEIEDAEGGVQMVPWDKGY
ncbi:hypothetical protein BT96DRAFT_940175 [Gymnopus androsaceus JB14]|uniref:Uncharacterized protein n=1 Tax=Gymnopus androsaceus JB14 TaxID=1447944 RepID=A0A6A4HJZ7_9AGAR|nr:hypothetical protein BT96DRAFT_940175 [Gymnopus androsaceus JB14]